MNATYCFARAARGAVSDMGFALLLLLATLASGRVSAADPYAELQRYTEGQPATAQLAIQMEIREASPAELRAIEAKLVDVIESREASADGKAWACRTLRLAGSAQSVPVLAGLLTDPRLAADAQYALRSIRGPEVDVALRAALPRTGGLLQAGIVQTLGARRDRQAVSVVAPLASADDPVVAEAALYALGHMGGREAMNALLGTQVPASLERYRQHAVLLCAESLRAQGRQTEAAAACRSLYMRSDDPVIRSGALRGLVLADPEAAAPLLAEALDVGSWTLRGAAARALCEVAPEGVFTTVLGRLTAWAPETQAMVLGLVAHPAALPVIRRAAQEGEEQVRSAALAALGRLGQAADVALLLGAAAKADASQPAARKALQTVHGPGVNEIVSGAMKTGPVAYRCEAIRAAVPRHQVEAVPELIALAKEAEPVVRTAARQALRELARPEDLPALVALLTQAGTDQDRETAESALAALAVRAPDQEVACSALVAALPGAPVAVRCALLRVLAQVPHPKSLEALRAAIKEDEPAVHDVAVRGLADWTTPAPLPDLLALARGANDRTHRVLALRGFIRLAALPSDRLPEQTVKLLGQAFAIAPTADEKKAVLGALAGIPQLAALNLAAQCLEDAAVEVEAAHAVVRLARNLQSAHGEAAGAAVQRILDTCKSPAARQLAETAGIILGGMVNIAPQGTATSPDGLEKDGAAGGDAAAIDGNPETYWDEADGAKVYRLVVTFKEPVPIAALSVMGYRHHDFAPKTFDVLCDGRVVKSVENAQYTDNFLAVNLPETACQAVELKITGYYGNSPAIRELGLYRR